MSVATYKLLHLIGIFLVFSALGGQTFYLANGGTKEEAKGRGMIGAAHGIGLLLLFVAGFGLHAKTGVEGFPGWVVGKLVIWLAFGGLIAVGWRKPELAKALFWSLTLLGAVAAWLALFKPF